MEWITFVIDLFLHVDDHLRDVAANYGPWVYALLFLIVFLETGVVVTPFLPGDSLLFAAGAVAALGSLDVTLILVLLTIAAVLGDSVNYTIGRMIGPRVFTQRSRFFKHEHLMRTQHFYERHGGKTVVLARFMPIIRTFAPFVAGVGRMHYPRFLAFNVGGAILWVWSIGLLGYFFGNVPIVKENFGLVIVAIIGLSFAPLVFELVRARFARGSGSAA